MGKRKTSDQEFIDHFQTLGAHQFALRYGLDEAGICRRRRRIEAKYKITLVPPDTGNNGHKLNAEKFAQNLGPVVREAFPGRLNISIETGVVLVAGDAHYWPGPAPLMHRALIKMIKEFRSDKVLRAVVMNGDVHDFAAISRWPHVNWEERPSVKDEIDTGLVRMGEIEDAGGPVQRFWPLGNHDSRYSVFIAAHARELEGIPGTKLKDHFPNWQPCWSVEINSGVNTTVIKHTFKGGIHAPRNNVLHAGCHFITNHLHSAKIVPITFRHHTFFGVDTGCLADTYGPQFLYCQDNPRDWRAAFAVLTFHKGALLMPELVMAVDSEHVQFRGKVYKI